MRWIHLHRPQFHFPFGSLLPHQVNRSVKELFASVGILGFALSAATLFEPIYLYTLRYSLLQIVGYYAVTYALYFFLVPLGAKFALRYGVERSILAGSILLIFYYLAFFGIARNPQFIFLAMVLAAVYKMFYWVAYHADFAQYSTKEEVGREVGGMSVVISITTIFGPVAGGAVIAAFGFPVLFVIVAALIVLSNVPLLFSPSQPARASFSYRDAYRRLVRKENLRRVITALGYGEDFLVAAFWPIFIYLVVGGAQNVGIIVTFSSLLTSLILLYIGRLTDLKNKFSVLRAGAALKSLVWIMRIAVITGAQVFLLDTLYRVASGSTEYPILTETYNKARESNVMAGVVLFEMALIVGKLLTMAAVTVLLWQYPASPWTSIFVLASIVSFFYAALSFRNAKAA